MASSVLASVVLISAIASGQGKTTVTAALARKLIKSGRRVKVFKIGPDFLDPMLLSAASRTEVETLDLWIVGQETCRKLLAEAAAQADVILIEGAMGLYDGNPSAADLANTFGLPVVAVLNAAAMAQTAGAVVLGLRDYGPVNLAGVIANRVASTMHADMVRESVRAAPLLSILSRQDESLPERHLGLVQACEVNGLEDQLDRLAEEMALDQQAWDALPLTSFEVIPDSPPSERPLEGRCIAIARDTAFAFIYPANLRCLQEMGARLSFFSPLADEPVPDDADALWLPGGYPELQGEALSQAQGWQESVRKFHAAGKPIVAECGGMMALAQTLNDNEGASWSMAGLLQGSVTMQKRLAGLGPQGWMTDTGELRGHAFHYSSFATTMEPVASTVKHPSQRMGEAIYREGALLASYFHAYFPSCPAAVARLFRGEAL